MTYNCLITIKKVSGPADNKSYTTLATNVRVLLQPIASDILALYGGLPAGQSYHFVIHSNALADIPAESDFTVTDHMASELADNDTFTTYGITQKHKVMGNVVHSGKCIKKEVEA